ncbi:MAG: hypothetical protein AB9872_12180 [Solidesulfovibrio sp.]
MLVTSEATLYEKFLLVLTGKFGIFTINLLLLCLSLLTLWFMLPLIFNAANNVTELEDISEYMGVMLIGYGVAVEERQSFMEIFKLYPKFTTPLQQHVDHLCHEYGLCYLLLGLFMEMCVACIKIPNAIIDTDSLEPVIFTLSALFLLWNTILMLRHSWFLVRAKD